MKNRQMGPLQLSGLIVGAVLGSGIILLPPIALSKLGNWSVAAWTMIMALGAVFASLFVKMALRYPGTEGVPIAVREAFGKQAGLLASNYIICAVLAGPVAVLMTASLSITEALHLSPDTSPSIALMLLLLCNALLFRKVTFVGSISLAASIAIAAVLLSGSIVTVISTPVNPLPHTPADIPEMGRTLLILFWAIIGWEITGNYSQEVRNPEKNIPRAAIIGVCTICAVYILTAWAMLSVYSGRESGPFQVAAILTPLFGSYAPMVIMLMTCILCICTFLMVAGGVARLISILAKSDNLPALLARNNSNNAPAAAIIALFCFHMTDLILLQFKILSLEQLIATANVFFLANALISVTAAIKLFHSFSLRGSCLILCTGFISLLIFSSAWNLLILAVVTIMTLRPQTTVSSPLPQREKY